MGGWGLTDSSHARPWVGVLPGQPKQGLLAQKTIVSNSDPGDPDVLGSCHPGTGLMCLGLHLKI